MQYVKTLLSVSLIFGTLHVQAETQTSVKDTPIAVAPSSGMQMAPSNDTSATAQVEALAAQSQPGVSTQDSIYEIPLSDHNHGGYFGE